MKFSLTWLQDYVNLSGVSADEISRAITFLGFEVEGVEHFGAPPLRDVVVGEVLTREKHPNADKLSICTVDVGPAGGVKTIVCGAQNYTVGDRVPVALPGAVLPGDFVIKQSKIRGQSSDGMMCSGKELGVGADHSGLLILTERPALGTPINSVLPPGDTVFDVEITPNRPDCLSHLGLARELAAWFRQPLRYPETPQSATRSAARADLLQAVRVDAPEDCPLYTATVVTGVKVGPSPRWLQDRLTAVGLRPINNIVDVGNYVLLELGQPMHAFDAKKLGGSSIIVRRAAANETLVTLDGKTRPLTPEMLVIADATKPVVVAGIMGGENSGVDETTTDLVLEVAVFRRQSIRATSKRLGLSSDSSYRYERGVDPHGLPEAVSRALDLIVQTAGGTCAPTVTIGGDVPWQREIVVAPAWIRSRLGFELPDDSMRAGLDALELTITRADTNGRGEPEWTVAVPSWRDDLDRPIDLVEEVLRLHGTDKIPAATVTAPGLLAEDDPVSLFNRRVGAYLIGQSFSECVTYTLRSAGEAAAWAPASALAGLGLANPFVEDQSHLRGSLIAGLLDSLQLNRSRGVTATRLFETGRIFLERNGTLVECAGVGFILAEEGNQAAWLPRVPGDFYTAKRLVATIAAEAGIEFERQPLSPSPELALGWQQGHSAVVGNLAHGWLAQFGLLDLALLQRLGFTGKIFGGVFAILPDQLTAGGARRRYQPFSVFPPALRDLAIVVEDATPAGDVQRAVLKAGRAVAGNAFNLERVEVFDVYRGQGLPAGRKSLAFSLTFRSPERTLTDEEVNAAFARLQDDLAKNGFVIRK